MSKIVYAIFPIYNLAQKVPFLEDLKKNVSKSDWNSKHIVYVTQIHYYTWFYITFGPKNAIILSKNHNFAFFKNSHFWLFQGVLEVQLKFQGKFYGIIDYNKCPSSEKSAEKCILRKSFFHHSEPRYWVFPKS